MPDTLARVSIDWEASPGMETSRIFLTRRRFD